MQVAWFAGATGAAIAVAPRGFAAVVLVATSFPVCGLLQANSPVARQSIDVSNLDLGFGAVAARAVIAVVFARTLPDGGLWASQKRRAVRAWIFPVSGLGLIFSLRWCRLANCGPTSRSGGGGVANVVWLWALRVHPARIACSASSDRRFVSRACSTWTFNRHFIASSHLGRSARCCCGWAFPTIASVTSTRTRLRRPTIRIKSFETRRTPSP